MTTLVPQVPSSALDGADDLATVIKTLADRKVTNAPEKPAVAPKVVQVKQDAKDAISRLNGELASTELPVERRRLTLDEQKKLLALAVDSKLAEKAVKAAVAAVKTAAFNHFDTGLREARYDEYWAANPEGDEFDALDYVDDQLSDVQDSKSGHYLVENTLVIPGTGKKFVRQLSQGSPTVTAEGLRKLYEAGKISRRDYYAMTRTPEVPRVVDEEGMLDRLKAKPELLSAIAEAIIPGNVTASFWVRDVKDDE